MLPRFGEGGKTYISGRNRTFFFVSAEFFRNRVGASSDRNTVPTPEMYNGDFSKWVDGSGRIDSDLRPGDDAAQSKLRCEQA
ncbi:MAG: hypothetical protein WKF84_03795 [Pyrinomonadaceae bacterium]